MLCARSYKLQLLKAKTFWPQVTVGTSPSCVDCRQEVMTQKYVLSKEVPDIEVSYPPDLIFMCVLVLI